MANPLWEGRGKYIRETNQQIKQFSEFYVTSENEETSDDLILDELADKLEALDFNPRELDLHEVDPTCDICGQTIRSKGDFKNNMVQKHKYDPTNFFFKCSCNQNVYKQKALSKHEKVVKH